MSTKDCGHHREGKLRLNCCRICSCLLVILIIISITIFLIWAFLQPKKPSFVLQDATLYSFNISSKPKLLTSSLQVTIISHNPNDKIGIDYDSLSIYATYHDQQITFPIAIPPNYQGHHEVDIWSPFLSGTAVPVAPFNSMSVSEDQSRGAIILVIKMEGRVRWKVGTFISGRYNLYVKCDAFLPFGSIGNATTKENVATYQMPRSCSVSV